jgi:hypothetical protein
MQQVQAGVIDGSYITGNQNSARRNSALARHFDRSGEIPKIAIE